MEMNYILWAIVAFVAYSVVPPLVRVATADIPSTVAAFLSNVVLVIVILGVILVRNEEVVPYLDTQAAGYLYLAGLALGVGILAYYRALELGPVSVVVPIFAMFIVGGSVLGFVFLEEDLTLRKGLGIVFGVLAIWLISG